jgi:hypothetical protein
MISRSVATCVVSLVILTRNENEAVVERRKKEKDFGNRLGLVSLRRKFPEDETRPISDENCLETTDHRSTLTRMTRARRKPA